MFPFYRFKYPDGTITPSWRLYLPVLVTNPKTKQSILLYGLVDTGADATLFPGSLATQLGHSLKGSGVKSSMTCGIEQSNVCTYRHTFTLELLTPDTKNVLRTFKKVEIDCADTEPPVLLGAKDFLTKFDVAVFYKKHEMLLSWK